MFADANTDDKLKFLFDLYDFNSIQTISLLDLELLINSLLIATSKIYGLGQDVQTTDLNALFLKIFQEGQRINLIELLVWVNKTEEVIEYFRRFRIEIPKDIPPNAIEEDFAPKPKKFGDQDQHESKFPPNPIKTGDAKKKWNFVVKSSHELHENKRAANFRAWLYTALQPIISYRKECFTIDDYLLPSDETKMKMEWVYGIRCQDTKRCLQYSVGRMFQESIGSRNKYEKKMAKHNEEIIYFVSSIVILLNVNKGIQRFYCEHTQEIISMALCNLNGDYVATGDMCENKPSIHIWNSRTLENVNVLQGIHHSGIHLLAFSSDDKFVITCGLGDPSAILIYDWQSGQVIISVSVKSATQDILVIRGMNPWQEEENQSPLLAAKKDQEPRPIEGFVLISLDNLIVFVFDQKLNQYRLSYVQLDLARNDTTSKPTCAISLLTDFKNQYFKAGSSPPLGKQQIDEDDAAILDAGHSLKHLIITGHEDGKVLIWTLQKYIVILVDYEVEVTSMSKCFEGIAISTRDGKIYIWDEYLYRCSKIIDLNTLPFKILSSHIVSMDFNQKRLIVVTIGGDVIEIILSDAGSTKTIKASRFSNIVTITGHQSNALTILSQTEETIMIGGDNGTVSSFDIGSHELIDIWNVGQPISALACLTLEEGNFCVAAGTEQGNIIIRQDWEEFIPRQHICGKKAIIDVKFSKNGNLIAAASPDQKVYLMKFQNGNYEALAAIKIDNGFPTYLNFSEDSSRIIITTSQRKFIILDPESFELHYMQDSISQLYWSSWQGKFPLITQSLLSGTMPVVLGNVSNIVVAGDDNGNIYHYKNVENIIDNIGNNYSCHSSNVCEMELTGDDQRLITLGQQDSSILQFKFKPIRYSVNRAANITRGIFDENELLKEQEIILDPDQDETLILELNYCLFKIEKVVDSIRDKNLLVRGANHPTVNQILCSHDFEKRELRWQRPPTISLKLENIYGILVSDKRNTVMYIHFFNQTDQALTQSEAKKKQILETHVPIFGEFEEKIIDNLLPRRLGNDYQTLLSMKTDITYDHIHTTCFQNLVYFTSRFGVVFDAQKRLQNFYQGHRNKISAIAKHPIKTIIATGEVNANPFIHIWDSKSMETLVILQTSHLGGVLHMTFSTDGQKLISVGMDKCFSIQIFNWRQNRTLAYRNTGYNPIFCIKFNPYNDQEFITCGYQFMAIYKLVGTHLTCKRWVNVYNEKSNLKNNLICFDFISFRVGHSVQTDIIFGNNLGDISTFCSNKYFLLREQAHDNVPINCLKITTELSKDGSVMIITAGEEGLLKLWDAAANLLQQIDIKYAISIQDLKNIKSYGIQSLDVYCCCRNSTQSPNLAKILCGVRIGDVIECFLNYNPKFRSRDDILKDPEMKPEAKLKLIEEINNAPQKEQMFDLTFFGILSGHSSLYISHRQKKIISCLYPLYGILASAGNDETLMFWDVDKRDCIVSKNIGFQATCLDFSSDGKYLAIGLSNGVFLLLDSRIKKINQGLYNEQYTVPTLAVIMCPKECNQPIINIKFSNRSDFIMISYNSSYKKPHSPEDEDQDQVNPFAAKVNEENIVHEHTDTNLKVDYEPSFALLFVNKTNPMSAGYSNAKNSKDPYVRMTKIVINYLEYQSSEEVRRQLAIYDIDFSQCDRFIEFCALMVDQDNNIMLESLDDIFLVWDIYKGGLIYTYDQLEHVKWSNWSLSSSVNARYVGNQFNKVSQEKEDELFKLEQLYMTQISRFDLLNYAIMGSIFGEIYTFRFESLMVDRDKLKDFAYNRVYKRQMSICKQVDALTSTVLSLNIFQNKKVFATSKNDQCIVQYRVEYEDQDWELDFNMFQTDIADPFGEIPHYSKFAALNTEIWLQRQEITEIVQRVDIFEEKDPACKLELVNIIGRRSYDRRNNVKIDQQNRIVYVAASLIVFLQDNIDPEDNSFVTQTFLSPQTDKLTSTCPEISCFVLSEDFRLLFVCTNQIEAKLIVWEVSTNIQLCNMTIPEFSIISGITVAYDNKHVLLFGVTPEFQLSIMLLDFTLQKIICQKLILHSLPFKIKDATFLPGYTRRFVTCGIQHMCFWQYNGQSLEFSIGEVAIPKAFSNIGSNVYSHKQEQTGKFGLALVCSETEMENIQKAKTKARAGMKQVDEELENIYVTFLCAVNLSDTLITSGDDGFLYMWEYQRIIRRTFAHQGAVLALDANSKLGFLASGGMDGVVILWRVLFDYRANTKSLDKLKEYNFRRNMDPKQAVMNPDLNVQSICIGFNRIVVGMRSGSIFEVQIQEDGSAKTVRANYDKQTKIRKWMRCTDHEVPISVAVDMNTERVFSITQSGLFTAWDLTSFDVIFQKPFSKSAQNIIAFKHSNKIMLVFEGDITVLSGNETNEYDELKEYDLKLIQINDAKINDSEQILAVATTSSQTPEVHLYEIFEGFNKLTTFFGFNSTIKYIDFSTDNEFIQIEDVAGEVQLFEIKTQRIIATDIAEFDVEWLGEGLRSYSPLENVRKQFTVNNGISQICKLNGLPIVGVGDEIGNIRFFNFPNNGSDGYYQLYSDHLYTITKCLFSHDKKYFFSSSSFDRCIFKWKINYNEDKCAKLLHVDIKQNFD